MQTPNSNDAIEYEVKLRKHIFHQKLCRNLYHTWRIESMRLNDNFVCIIHDEMDHIKTIIRLQVCNKMIFELGQLPITLTNIIAHKHGDKIYV